MGRCVCHVSGGLADQRAKSLHVDKRITSNVWTTPGGSVFPLQAATRLKHRRASCTRPLLSSQLALSGTQK